MSLLIAILIGLAVGGVSGWFLREEGDLMPANMIFGIAGAVFGLGCYLLLFMSDAVDTTGLFSVKATLFSLLGAFIAVGAFDLIHILLSRRAPFVPPTGNEPKKRGPGS